MKKLISESQRSSKPQDIGMQGNPKLLHLKLGQWKHHIKKLTFFYGNNTKFVKTGNESLGKREKERQKEMQKKQYCFRTLRRQNQPKMKKEKLKSPTPSPRSWINEELESSAYENRLNKLYKPWVRKRNRFRSASCKPKENKVYKTLKQTTLKFSETSKTKYQLIFLFTTHSANQNKMLNRVRSN